MIKQSPPELFSQRPVRSDFGRDTGPVINLRRLFILIGLAVLAIGAGIGVNMMNREEEQVPAEVPTIKAEAPLKERPEQPGGLDVPHQDVTVFQQLEDKKGPDPVKGAIEHLLPPPEMPQAQAAKTPETVKAEPQNPLVEKVASELPKEEDLPPPITAAQPMAKAEKLIEETPSVPEKAAAVKTVQDKVEPVKKEAVVEKKVEATVKVESPVTTTAPKLDKPKSADMAKAETAVARLPKELFVTGEVPSSPAKPESKAETISKTDAAPAGGKTVRVQLASFPSEQEAEMQAKKLQAKFASSLGGASLQIVRVDLGAKGIYYRVMSGQVPEAKAKAICADITSQKASCLVAR